MFLPLTDPLVATFNETHAPTSRKHVAEQGIVMPNWSKTFQTFWLHSSNLALEKQAKNLNFHSVFTSNGPFCGYFQWNACTYFQKICSWTMYSDAKLIKNISNFWLHSSVFPLENYFKNLNFWSVFDSKRALCDYFLWNVCSHFWIISSWTTYSDTINFADTLSFMVALLSFYFRKGA